MPTSSKRRRGEPEFANGLDDRGRAIIPGERRSARMSAKDEYAAEEEPADDSYSDEIQAVAPANGGSNGDGIGEDDDNDNDDDNDFVDNNDEKGQSRASSPPISSESGMDIE